MKYPKNGKFGEFGGQYIPETLVPAIEELEENYLKFKNDRKFKQELDYYLKVYAGRPTPLYYAKNLSEKLGGAKIYLKREDLLHGGAHKINNTIGQGLLAKKMNKKRIIAETGAGQHGVATATVAAKFHDATLEQIADILQSDEVDLDSCTEEMLERVRAELFCSFGSCSIDDPRTDLQAMGLLQETQ